MLPLILKGFLLGWSVAWPPGPINAEMIRRGLERGFWSAWSVGLGACSGDAAWALAVAFGAGAIADLPHVRPALGALSVTLLLFLAWSFGKGAARTAIDARVGKKPEIRTLDSARGGFLLGLGLALTSPWNLAFWLAVMGAQATEVMALTDSLVLAAAVVAGAATWSFIVCGAVQFGAKFATPAWHVATQGATSLLMLVFAARAAWRLYSGS